MKKILAAIMSLCIVGGSLPVVYSGAPEYTITAIAETDYQGNEYEDVTEDGLTYRVYADHAELSECDRSVEGEITIPGKFKGVPVTRINSMAFYFCASLKSVTIPNSVTSIDKEAFTWCSSLISVTIPDSVTSI